MEVYVDDMLVKSVWLENHLAYLAEMFDILRVNGIKLNPNKCKFGVFSGKFLGFVVNQRGIEANMNKIKAILSIEAPQAVKDILCLTGRAVALNWFVSKATDRCLPFFRVLSKAPQFEWTLECKWAFI